MFRCSFCVFLILLLLYLLFPLKDIILWICARGHRTFCFWFLFLSIKFLLFSFFIKIGGGCINLFNSAMVSRVVKISIKTIKCLSFYINISPKKFWTLQIVFATSELVLTGLKCFWLDKKHFSLLNLTFWTMPKMFGPVQNNLEHPKQCWTYKKTRQKFTVQLNPHQTDLLFRYLTQLLFRALK